MLAVLSRCEVEQEGSELTVALDMLHKGSGYLAVPVFFYPSLFARTCIAFQNCVWSQTRAMNLLMIDILHFS